MITELRSSSILSSSEATVMDMRTTLDRANWLLEQAALDPALLHNLVEQPLDIMDSAQVDIWLLFRAILDLPYATDGEVLDVLTSRIRRASTRMSNSAFCGACGTETCALAPDARP
jgi:hypothetical protein